MKPQDLTPDIYQQVMKLSDDILHFLGQAGKAPNTAFLALCMTLARMSASTPSYTLKRIVNFTTGFRKACEHAQQKQTEQDNKQWN